MGNSPKTSQSRTSNLCLRAHRAVSKMQVLQTLLNQIDIELLEQKVLDLECVAESLSRKYAPKPMIHDAYTLIAHLAAEHKCRILQFLSNEPETVWEIILQFPTIARMIAVTSLFALPKECLYEIGSNIRLIDCVRDKQISLQRFYYVIRFIGSQLVYGCCRDQVNRTRLENLVWYLYFLHLMEFCGTTIDPSLVYSSIMFCFHIALMHFVRLTNATTELKYRLLRFGVNVTTCKDVANNLIKPTILEYSKDSLNWELKLLANKTLLEYWCEGKLLRDVISLIVIMWRQSDYVMSLESSHNSLDLILGEITSCGSGIIFKPIGEIENEGLDRVLLHQLGKTKVPRCHTEQLAFL